MENRDHEQECVRRGSSCRTLGCCTGLSLYTPAHQSLLSPPLDSATSPEVPGIGTQLYPFLSQGSGMAVGLGARCQWGEEGVGIRVSKEPWGPAISRMWPMASGLWFWPRRAADDLAEVPHAFPSGSRGGGSGGGREVGQGGGSCEVCGLGCEVHIRESPDTPVSGPREPLLATDPFSCFWSLVSPQILLCLLPILQHLFLLRAQSPDQNPEEVQNSPLKDIRSYSITKFPENRAASKMERTEPSRSHMSP